MEKQNVEQPKVEQKVAVVEKETPVEQKLTGKKIPNSILREVDATSNLLREKKVEVGSPIYNICMKFSGQTLKEDAIRRYSNL